MGILKLIGLKTAKGCCFYPVSKDSAVLVGIKYKKGKSVSVPERIGKYTVRGIDDPFCSGCIGDAYASLDKKSQIAVKMKLNDYELLSQVKLSQLPPTVEYIGLLKFRGCDFYQENVQIPSHVHYIRNLQITVFASVLTTIIFPGSLRYLGSVQSWGLTSIEFCGPNSNTPPHLRLSDYFGAEMKEVP